MTEMKLVPTRLCKRLFQGARAMAADRRGVAALEFAFMAPILLCMYLMTMEVSQGVETNKKLGRAGSMVGDLITQQSCVTTNIVDDIMKIGVALLQPYNRSQPTITVTAIQMGAGSAPTGTVLWSRRMTGTTFAAAPGAAATVPSTLRTAGSFLIRVDAALAYKPVILYTAGQKAALGIESAFDGISMNETYFLRPRMSPDIPLRGSCD
jgi:Flp pilus assembly protein TadG